MQPPYPYAPESPSVAPDGPAPQTGYPYGGSRRPPANFASQLREWVDIIARGRRYIIGALLLVLVPSVVYALRAPDVYQATARLYVETGTGGSLEAVLPGADQSFVQDRAIWNELYILQNAEDLADRTAQALMERGEAAGGTALTVLQPSDETPVTIKLVAARLMQDYLSIEQDGTGVNGVRVTARSQEPKEAELIANLYAQAYVDRTQSSSRTSVSASREFLEAQVDSVSTQLVLREDAAREYMDREGAVRLEEETSNLVSQVAALEAERDQARVEAGMEAARISELQGQIAQLQANIGIRLGSGTDRQLQQAEQRRDDLQGRLDGIYLRNPALRTAVSVPDEVADLRRQIATLDRSIEDLSRTLAGEAQAAGGTDPTTSGIPRLSALRDRLTESTVALRGLRSQIQILNGRIASYQAELNRVPAQALELARLERERESAERLATGLDQRLQEARVAESAELGYAEVIHAADTPYAPVAPNRLRIILLGLLVGLGVGVALAIIRAQLDQAVRRPAQLRELGYPVLGVVPDIGSLVEEDFGGADTVDLGGRAVDSRLVSLLAPLSTAAEAFRGIRTSVQFARPDAIVKTLLITSSSPSEGKSTVAANLATVMAQAGRRTLLVDADLRRPKVHRMFGVPRSPGLTDLLVSIGEDPSNSPLGAFHVADDLDVLPAGALVPNPAEHLGSRALRDLLDRLREHYDVVVFDAPPVMAATDAVLLSTQVDATVLVVSAGSTKDYELEYATEEIAAVGGRGIGVVLNRFDVSSEYGYRYQYAYRYGRKYGYGQDQEAK